MSRWVQHMSGQGKKYELTDNIWNREDNSSWRVYNPVNKDFNWLYLPRALEEMTGRKRDASV